MTARPGRAGGDSRTGRKRRNPVTLRRERLLDSAGVSGGRANWDAYRYPPRAYHREPRWLRLLSAAENLDTWQPSAHTEG